MDRKAEGAKNIFVYGTLKDPAALRRLLGSIRADRDRALNREKVERPVDGETYPDLQKSDGAVSGKRVSVPADKLPTLDRWEEKYKREPVQLESGGKAEAYVLKDSALREEVRLQPQQQRVIERIKNEPAVLVYHGLGSGKTLASIAAGETLGGTREVIVPASLRENFRKELKKFVSKPKDYDVKSYHEAVRRGISPADLTIFDEAHRLGRGESQTSALPRQVGGKALYLTGTPVRNDPSELAPLLPLLAADRGAPVTQEAFAKKFIEEREVSPGFFGRLWGITPGVEKELIHKNKLRDLLSGRVDYHPAQGEYPAVTTKTVEVRMSPEQDRVYRGLMARNPMLSYKIRNNLPPSKVESKSLNAFLSAVRQASNNPASFDVTLTGSPVKHSPKLRRMLADLTKGTTDDVNFKAFVYSNYLDSGVLPLSQELSALKIPNAVFHGGLSDAERRRIVEDYNAGRLKVLLASGAGSEGLDLKGTKMVQIMEPHWNASRVDQVVGRAVRHMSHSHLPESERTVEVRKYFSKPIQGFIDRLFGREATGADHYLNELSNKKEDLIRQLLGVLQEVGSRPVAKAASADPQIHEVIALLLEKRALSAVGIPDRGRLSDPIRLRAGKPIPWVVQKHEAERAGLHRDVRMGAPGLESWAVRKGMPAPGQKHLAVLQPVHCFPPSTLVETEEGPISISKIVRNRMKVRVLSTDETNNLIYEEIVNYWHRPMNEPIVSIAVSLFTHARKYIRCTIGHELYALGKKVKAGDVKVGDLLDVLHICPNRDQLQILYGGILGDSSVTKDFVYRFGHSPKQADYFYWKLSVLSDFVKGLQTIKKSRSIKGLAISEGVWLSASGKHSFFSSMRELYRSGSKEVYDDFLDECCELALAVWYQDDGSIIRSRSRFGGCSFATHGFSKQSVDRLQSWLKRRFDLDSFCVKRYVKSNGDTAWELRLSVTNALKLFSIISKFVHPSMRYKLELPRNWHTYNCRVCGSEISACTRICDYCVLEDIKRFRHSTQHRAAYCAGETEISPKLINNRCGTWRNAKLGIITRSASVSEYPPSFACGAALSSLNRVPIKKVMPLKVVFAARTQPKSGERYVYNLEVRNTHRYVVNRGFVVGNSGSYASFQGRITEGYGKGRVTTEDRGTVFVTKAERDKINFIVAHKKFPEYYSLVRTTKGRSARNEPWLLINTTPTDPLKMLGGKTPEEVGFKKVRYASVPADKVEKLFDGNYMNEAKIDGAAALLHLLGDRIEALSYRVAKRGTPIIHTQRIFGVSGEHRSVKIPKEYVGTIMKAEIFGTKGKQVIPPQELGGLLNAALSTSLAKQQEHGIQLRLAPYGLVRLGKEPVGTLGAEERRKILKDIVGYLPKGKFIMPEAHTDPAASRKMWEQIRAGEHPLTREGIVGHPLAGGRPVKAKLRPESDVFITSVFPGTGRFADRAGGFYYATAPDGTPVGKVGTGFSEQTRLDMWKRPEDFVGRMARIDAQEQFPGGAYRAPSFISLHEDWPANKDVTTPKEQTA